MSVPSLWLRRRLRRRCLGDPLAATRGLDRSGVAKRKEGLSPRLRNGAKGTNHVVVIGLSFLGPTL